MLPDGHLREALTFDDVLLVPAESDVLPKDVDVRTQLTAGIRLANPIISSAMDTVTEAATAICMAREGGIGIIHKNFTIAEQALEVSKVKKAESGMVIDPVTIAPDQQAARRRRADAPARHLRRARGRGRRAAGRHPHHPRHPLRAQPRPAGERDDDPQAHHRAARAPAVEARRSCCTSTASRSCWSSTRRRLLKGLITIKDIEKAQQHPLRGQGRPRPPARRRRGRRRRRSRRARRRAARPPACDVIVIDTAHGHSRGVHRGGAPTCEATSPRRRSSPATSPPPRRRWR